MSRQHENTITTKLVDILNRMRSTWSLEEQTRPYELDQRFLTEVLGITSDDVHAAVHRLREKLCAEPSIHGGKKSRCDLAAEARKLGGNLV